MADLTKRNLKEAFAGESQAQRKYDLFAAKAEADGFANVARLFRAASEAEAIHAANHLKALQAVGSTIDNVQEALNGETEESTGLYLMFIDQAQRDADNEALKSFFWAKEAEVTHQELFEKALDSLKQGQDAKFGNLWICDVCGYTAEGEAPEKCPTCNVGREHFNKVS